MNTLAGQQESPIARANARAMQAMDETGKLIQELKQRISDILRPLCPLKSDGAITGAGPRDVASPLADGTNDRAAQIESNNAELRDVLSRIEL